MKAIKEKVKAGEVTAREALTELANKAKNSNTLEHFKTSQTCKWLKRRA